MADTLTGWFMRFPAVARWVAAGTVSLLALVLAYEAFGWWGVGVYIALALAVVVA